MTIAAAYLTSEGAVLGADSTTTVEVPSPRGGPPLVVQLLNHAQKIYEIGQDSSFGLCTFGAGRIGTLSHRTISAHLGDKLNERPAGQVVNVDWLGCELIALLNAETVKPGAAPFQVGYFIGGIDPGREPRVVEVSFEFNGLGVGGKPTTKVSTIQLAIGEARFQGAPDYFSRIFHGYSSGLPGALLNDLTQLLVQQNSLPANFDKTFTQAFGSASAQFASVGFQDLPLREAIDYIHTYLVVTIKAFKFRYGPPPCGGPVEIAYISTDRCFRWARHKSFQSAVSEHQEAT